MLQGRSHELVQSLCQSRGLCPQQSVLRPEVGGGRAVGRAAEGGMMGSLVGPAFPLIPHCASVPSDHAVLCAHQVVLLRPHPPWLQHRHQHVCAYVSGGPHGLHHHCLWLLGLRGSRGTETTTLQGWVMLSCTGSRYLGFSSCGSWALVKVTQSCPTLCDPMGYTVHGILQARILEVVAFPFSRGYFQTRDRSHVSCIAGGFFIGWVTREAQEYWSG